MPHLLSSLVIVVAVAEMRPDQRERAMRPSVAMHAESCCTLNKMYPIPTIIHGQVGNFFKFNPPILLRHTSNLSFSVTIRSSEHTYTHSGALRAPVDYALLDPRSHLPPLHCSLCSPATCTHPPTRRPVHQPSRRIHRRLGLVNIRYLQRRLVRVMWNQQ